MAEVLETYEFTPRIGLRRYPWNEWMDGRVWRIRYGEDYHIVTQNMRSTLHVRAANNGQKVHVSKEDKDTLVFQFYVPEES